MLDLLSDFAEGAIGSLQFLAALPVVAVDHQAEAVAHYHDVLVSDGHVLSLGEVIITFLLVLSIFLDNEAKVFCGFFRSLGRWQVVHDPLSCVCLILSFALFGNLVKLGALKVYEGFG